MSARGFGGSADADRRSMLKTNRKKKWYQSVIWSAESTPTRTVPRGCWLGVLVVRGPLAKLEKWPSRFEKTKLKKLDVMHLVDLAPVYGMHRVQYADDPSSGENQSDN
jgi:hypothetical protein